MPNKATSLYEHDLFVRSEARQETLLRNAYARQEQRGNRAQDPTNASAPLSKLVPDERRPDAK